MLTLQPFHSSVMFNPTRPPMNMIYEPENKFHELEPQNVFSFTGISDNQTGQKPDLPTGIPTLEHIHAKRKPGPLESIALLEDYQSPCKMRISEQVMSDHFSGMCLSSTGDCVNATIAAPTTLSVWTNGDPEVANDRLPSLEAIQDRMQDGSEDDCPVMQMSSCLKHHLKHYPPECPPNLLLPKPVSAIVLYDPDNVPPSFKTTLSQTNPESPPSDGDAFDDDAAADMNEAMELV